MTRTRRLVAAVSTLAVCSAPVVLSGAPPATTRCRLEVLLDGQPAREYRTPVATYIEAVKGKSYELRLHNPFDVRVAVALSVDGLDTIDARRTTATAARKWVIDPHDTITISGWQTSMTQARRFYFTSEEHAYATKLGQPDNLGVITAVFFRERAPVVLVPLTNSRDTQSSAGRGAPASPAPGAAEKGATAAALGDEYAATGIGERTEHRVSSVHLDLESAPAATIEVHYEYRAQLARLGLLADPRATDPLSRRQGARGFEPGFCPDIR